MDGAEATRQIVELAGDGPIRVLVPTTFNDDRVQVATAARAGSSCRTVPGRTCCLEDVPRADLLRAVRIVAAGESLLAPIVTRRQEFGVVSRPTFV